MQFFRGWAFAAVLIASCGIGGIGAQTKVAKKRFKKKNKKRKL